MLWRIMMMIILTWVFSSYLTSMIQVLEVMCTELGEYLAQKVMSMSFTSQQVLNFARESFIKSLESSTVRLSSLRYKQLMSLNSKLMGPQLHVLLQAQDAELEHLFLNHQLSHP